MIEYEPFSMPLADPLETAAGTITDREGFLVRVGSRRTAVGVGEATPLGGWTEPLDACRDALDAAAAAADATDAETALAGMDADATPAARHGVSLALLDRRARDAGEPLFHRLGAAVPDRRDAGRVRVPLNATIGDGPPGTTAQRARAAVDDGFDCLKLKVGRGTVERDLDRVRAVRDAAPDATLRLDANAAWSAEEAAHVARAVGDAVEYLEQPLDAADLDGHAALRDDAPVALDESVAERGVDAILDARAADYVVLKPMAIGGVDRARELSLRARSGGLTPVLSNTIDGVVARSAARHVVASLPGGTERAHGLATGGALASDLADDPGRVEGDAGVAALTGVPGHGVDGVKGVRGPGGVDWPTRSLLAHRERTTPDRTALVDAGTGDGWTYRELDERTTGPANALEAACSPGATVAVLMDTRPEFVETVWGAMRAGLPLAPLNVRSPPDRLRACVDRVAPEALVCEASTEAVAVDITGSRCEVVSVDRTDRDAVSELHDDTGDPDGTSGAIDRRTEAFVLFTSGTTGDPKGVRLTVGNAVASAVASAFRVGVRPGDRWLCPLPMYHAGGLLTAIRAALYGTTLVVQRDFDPEGTAAAIDAHGVTGVSLVPAMLTRLLDAGWSPPDHLRTVLLGGGPIPDALLDRCDERDVPVHPTYGLTETASGIATARPDEAMANPGTVGRPHLFTDVDVVDPEAGAAPAPGDRCEAGETGELRIAGPTVTPGYLDPERTAAAFDDAGRLRTGDRGHRDADGRLWVDGRLDDLISTGGETVAPATVADALREVDGIADAAVVGLDDPEWGERVAALVVPDRPSGNDAADDRGTGVATDRDAIAAACRRRLAGHERPRTVGVADALPRTPSGTVDRDAVRERLRDDGVRIDGHDGADTQR